ncbi:hypothetical protein AB1Y20_003598 [Prymnesium parvum]|uniref:Heme O synthase n=1 Tax=Prymnesium parvum TaxID=97485 RepID=A0AB34J566_PRYPA
MLRGLASSPPAGFRRVCACAPLRWASSRPSLPPPTPPTPPTLLERRPDAWMRVYMELSKSRLSALVVMTTAAGYTMGAAPPDPYVAAATLGGTFLCAASANSFNQLLESPRDAAMNRTARRPLPSGRITPQHAAAWASAAGATGVGTLLVGTNPLTAALGLSTLGMYTLLYTPMKPLSPWNTWVGAVVGAIPPVMGWTAAGGALLTPEAASLFGALFLWQIPHFLALAWMYRADYAQGGYQMVPLTDPTGERTASLCLQYSLYLALLPPACWSAGVSSCMFAVESLGFNGLLLFAAWRFKRNHARGQAHARRLFLASLAYLPIFFACLLLHQERPPPPPPAVTRRPLGVEHLSEAGLLYEEGRNQLREKGRELCLHEHVVHTADDEAAATRACPVVLGKTSSKAASELIESAAGNVTIERSAVH